MQSYEHCGLSSPRSAKLSGRGDRPEGTFRCAYMCCANGQDELSTVGCTDERCAYGKDEEATEGCVNGLHAGGEREAERQGTNFLAMAAFTTSQETWYA